MCKEIHKTSENVFVYKQMSYQTPIKWEPDSVYNNIIYLYVCFNIFKSRPISIERQITNFN